MKSLVLPKALHHEIVRHATASLPREAVGLVGGDVDGLAKTVMKLRNLAPGTKSFLADPYDQFLAFRRLEFQQLKLLAIYHSHPGGGTDMSAFDVLYAQHWDCAHLVIAVAGHGVPEGSCRAFCVVEGGARRTVPVDITS